jgi:hypothetical protein
MCEGWIKNYVHDTKGPRVQNTYVIVRDLMEGLVEFHRCHGIPAIQHQGLMLSIPTPTESAEEGSV